MKIVLDWNQWNLPLSLFLIKTPEKEWHICIYNRVKWEIFFFHFNSWYTFSSVFFNSKTGLFSCIFWFEDSFLCKFTYLHLLSRLQGRICQKIYDGWKKYFVLTNVSFQCHTSSWNTPITMRKWFQNFTKVSGSPIFYLLKFANLGDFTNIGKAKNRTSDNFCKGLKPLSNSNRGISRGCMTLE